MVGLFHVAVLPIGNGWTWSPAGWFPSLKLVNGAMACGQIHVFLEVVKTGHTFTGWWFQVYVNDVFI